MPLTPSGQPSSAFIHALPKAELHIHLEGSVQPQTWLRIIRRHDPATTVTEQDLRDALVFENLDEFLGAYMGFVSLLKDPDDYRLAAYELGLELKSRNAWYLEVHSSAAGAEWAGRLKADDIIEATAAGLDDAKREGGPEWRIIVDIIRDLAAVGCGEVGLDAALRNRRNGVIGIGLGGYEPDYPANVAREIFAKAAAEGLRRTAHAGEASGPDSIRAALEIGAERIGHATSANMDEALLDQLQLEQTPLEMCPSSNVMLGSVKSIEEHPVGELLRRGLLVSVNTDDPPFFDTDLDREYEKVVRAFDLNRDETVLLARNAFESAFLPDADKHAMLNRFHAAVSALP